MIKLPEPCRTVVDPTYVAMNAQQPYGTALYTEAQLKQAVSDAYYEAAKLCDEGHELQNSSFQGVALRIRAQAQEDSNDIAVAVWSAIKEAQQAQPEREPLTMEQCKAKFEAWYASAPDAEPEPDRTYDLSDESMSELTKDCIWLGWQAAHGIKGGQHD